MKEKISSIGSVFTAILASICCLGPLILVGLGIGSVGFAMRLAKYRTVFIIITLGLLALAFYFTYRKKGGESAPNPDCPAPKRSFINKLILWVCAAIAIFLILLQYIISAPMP
ncbi:MAG: mercuric transporter MerT family protein [Candidatus Poribacteria bacterium]